VVPPLNLIYSGWGARIGRDVYLDCSFIFDSHMLEIGNGCIVLGILDCHGPDPTTTKWAMKFGPLKLGDYTEIHPLSVISMELETEARSILFPISRVLVGDIVKTNQCALGTPAKMYDFDTINSTYNITCYHGK
jgi:hypothetical protein